MARQLEAGVPTPDIHLVPQGNPEHVIEAGKALQLLAPEYDNFPEKSLVESTILTATSNVASSTHGLIIHFNGGVELLENLPKTEKDRRTKIIDNNADPIFKEPFERADYINDNIDDEGGKEAHKDKLGEAMLLTIGELGHGTRRTTSVSDKTENSTAAVHGRTNAISIVGVSTYRGITKIPNRVSDGKEATHFRKLFAPGEFKNDLAIDRSMDYNIRKLMDQDVDPKKITLAIMERECNKTLIDEARKLGVKIELITSGDLMWGARAMLSDPENPIIMGGRGGSQEGAIAMVLARAIGGTGQLRMVEETEDIEVEDFGPIWTADQYVPGSQDQSMVIFSAITQNTHFGLAGVSTDPRDASRHIVESIIFDKGGARKDIRSIPGVPYDLAA